MPWWNGTCISKDAAGRLQDLTPPPGVLPYLPVALVGGFGAALAIWIVLQEVEHKDDCDFMHEALIGNTLASLLSRLTVWTSSKLV